MPPRNPHDDDEALSLEDFDILGDVGRGAFSRVMLVQRPSGIE